MNGTTIILWITIFIIGVIAIILVKLHYRGAELEKDEKPILSKESINNLMPNRPEDTSQQHSTSYSQQFQENVPASSPIEVIEHYNPITEVEENNYKNIEYESQNQILINYENQIKKTQEPMKEYQVEIMTQDNNEKHELKDLFTIDELIKESKRKDSEREKEAQRINSEEDEELNELKESIRKRKENDEIEDKLIEEILADEEIGKILEESETDNAEEVNNIENVIEDEKPQAETIENIISEESEEKSEPSEKTVTPEVKEQTIPDTITKKPKEETIADALTEEPKEESVQEVLDVEVEVIMPISMSILPSDIVGVYLQIIVNLSILQLKLQPGFVGEVVKFKNTDRRSGLTIFWYVHLNQLVFLSTVPSLKPIVENGVNNQWIERATVPDLVWIFALVDEGRTLVQNLDIVQILQLVLQPLVYEEWWYH